MSEETNSLTCKHCLGASVCDCPACKDAKPFVTKLLYKGKGKMGRSELLSIIKNKGYPHYSEMETHDVEYDTLARHWVNYHMCSICGGQGVIYAGPSKISHKTNVNGIASEDAELNLNLENKILERMELEKQLAIEKNSFIEKSQSMKSEELEKQMGVIKLKIELEEAKAKNAKGLISKLFGK